MRPVLGKDDVAAFLARLADLQMHHSGAEMAEHLLVPIAYYLPDRIVIFSTREKIAARLDAHRAHLYASRVRRIEARGLDLRDATPDRALVRFEWHYLCARGETLRSAQVQYVLCRPGGGPDLKLEMVDYNTIGFAQFMQVEFPGGRA